MESDQHERGEAPATARWRAPVQPEAITRVGQRTFLSLLASYPIVGGTVTLLGWALGIRELTAWDATGYSMQPNGAIASLLAGCALLAVVSRQHLAATALGAATALIGGATIAQHLLGVSFGIDEVFLRPAWGTDGTTAPGRMGPPASMSFTFIGIGLLLSQRATDAASRLVSAAGLFTVAVALLSLIGRIFQADYLYSLPRATAIAPQTSSMILALGFGLIGLAPNVEPMRTLRRGATAAAVVRRLLPFMILLPILLGAIQTRGEHLLWFDSAFGAAVRTLAEIVLLCLLTWWAARLIGRYEAAQQSVEEDLGKKNSLLAAIVESSDDAIIGLSLEGKITTWNRGAGKLFGYDAHEIIGLSINILIPPERQGEDDTVLSKIRRGERVDHFETERIAKDGKRLAIWLTVSPIRDVTGKVVGASKVSRDITFRKNAEREIRESAERLRLATEATGVGIWEWNLATGTMRWDPQMFRIYGIQPTPNGHVDIDVWRGAVVPEDLEALDESLRETINSCRRHTRTFRIVRASDSQQRVIAAVETVRTDSRGVARWVLGTNQDVTQALAWSGERPTNAAAFEAQRSERIHDMARLARAIRHELVNVLLPLKWQADMLAAKDLSPDARTEFDDMLQRARHLETFADALHDLAGDPQAPVPDRYAELAEFWQHVIRDTPAEASPPGSLPGSAPRDPENNPI
ncbi:MAG: PAS domain-containing protein [Phycisphaerales bacterium]